LIDVTEVAEARRRQSASGGASPAQEAVHMYAGAEARLQRAGLEAHRWRPANEGGGLSPEVCKWGWRFIASDRRAGTTS
jgi:hypothetical protein